MLLCVASKAFLKAQVAQKSVSVGIYVDWKDLDELEDLTALTARLLNSQAQERRYRIVIYQTSNHRGAVGAPAPPRAVEIFFSGVIYRENV